MHRAKGTLQKHSVAHQSDTAAHYRNTAAQNVEVMCDVKNMEFTCKLIYIYVYMHLWSEGHTVDIFTLKHTNVEVTCDTTQVHV